MFACLFGRSPHLAALAAQFSPLVETVDPDTIVFSIAGLGRLFGDTNQIVSEISRRHLFARVPVDASRMRSAWVDFKHLVRQPGLPLFPFISL